MHWHVSLVGQLLISVVMLEDDSDYAETLAIYCEEVRASQLFHRDLAQTVVPLME
jgi:hypothetical protein